MFRWSKTRPGRRRASCNIPVTKWSPAPAHHPGRRWLPVCLETTSFTITAWCQLIVDLYSWSSPGCRSTSDLLLCSTVCTFTVHRESKGVVKNLYYKGHSSRGGGHSWPLSCCCKHPEQGSWQKDKEIWLKFLLKMYFWTSWGRLLPPLPLHGSAYETECRIRLNSLTSRCPAPVWQKLLLVVDEFSQETAAVINGYWLIDNIATLNSDLTTVSVFSSKQYIHCGQLYNFGFILAKKMISRNDLKWPLGSLTRDYWW